MVSVDSQDYKQIHCTLQLLPLMFFLVVLDIALCAFLLLCCCVDVGSRSTLGNTMGNNK